MYIRQRQGGLGSQGESIRAAHKIGNKYSTSEVSYVPSTSMLPYFPTSYTTTVSYRNYSDRLSGTATRADGANKCIDGAEQFLNIIGEHRLKIMSKSYKNQ